MTALHLATALAREGALKLLVQHGASPEARAADGQTPLGVALSIGRRDLADWLDWRVWPLPRRTLREADLPAAAMAGDVDAVRRLIDLGFAVDAVDAQGCTALLRAAGGGHLAVTDLLLARGADPQHARPVVPRRCRRRSACARWTSSRPCSTPAPSWNTACRAA
jgi:ankyrin repeat protein